MGYVDVGRGDKYLEAPYLADLGLKYTHLNN